MRRPMIIDEGLLVGRYDGGSWILWKCRLCGACDWQHVEEGIDEYKVHRSAYDAERCLDRWARKKA